MTTLDLSGYTGSTSKTKKKPEWEPPTFDVLSPGSVLAFDQSLDATGWVWLNRGWDRCTVVTAGSYSAPGEGQGHERNLTRGVQVAGEVGRILDRLKPLAVAHETPPRAGGKMSRPESSLLAALAVRIEVHRRGLPLVMLGAQPAKRLVCGNSNADKKEAHAALARYCAPWIDGYDQITNEAKRDALMIGLLYLAVKGDSDATP